LSIYIYEIEKKRIAVVINTIVVKNKTPMGSNNQDHSNENNETCSEKENNCKTLYKFVPKIGKFDKRVNKQIQLGNIRMRTAPFLPTLREKAKIIIAVVNIVKIIAIIIFYFLLLIPIENTIFPFIQYSKKN
jgi:hypothetical protein